MKNEDYFKDMSKGNRDLFIRALSDATESEIMRMDEEIKDMEMPPPSKRHKIRMNRIFRERTGSSSLPFPEVDNIYERIRSKLIIKLKINEFRDHRESRSKR